MTKLAISCITKGRREFIKTEMSLLASNAKTVKHLFDATLFDDPDIVEKFIAKYPLKDPVIEVVKVKYKRQIGSDVDKYNVFLTMAEERMIPDAKKKRGIDATEENDNYSIYLFGLLWDNYHPEHKDLEYDIRYEKIFVAYKCFIDSKSNNPDHSLYECIEEYLGSAYKTRTIPKRVGYTCKTCLDKVLDIDKKSNNGEEK